MELFQFQKEAIQEACTKFKGRALIALDMGLGKTPVAIASAYKLNARHTLIVCPASLRLNWVREIETWSRELFPLSSSLSPLKITLVENGKTEIMRNNTRANFVVISYEQAAARVLELAAMNFDMVIVDESHYIKNRTAKRTRCVVALCRQAKFCLLLTGTPVLNRPIELWCQLEALHYSLGSYWAFAKRYCAAFRGRFGWDVTGASNLSELNGKLLNNIMVRRKKSDVLTELPDKNRVRISVGGLGRAPLGAALRKACEKALKKNSGSIREALEYMRGKSHDTQDCIFSAYSELATLKAESTCDIMLQMVSSGAPLVVFAHHKSMIAALSHALSEGAIPFSVITGDTPLEARQKCVDDFQSGKIKVCVLSITAASTGLTLTAASDMLITELPFAPGVALQAEDRIHRIGQRNAVTIRYVCADNTLDDALWNIVTSKNRVANQILDASRASDFDGSATAVLGNYWAIVEQVLQSCLFEMEELGTVLHDQIALE